MFSLIFRLANICSALYVFTVEFYCSILICVIQLAVVSLGVFLNPFRKQACLQYLSGIWWNYAQFCVECWAGVGYVFSGDNFPSECASGLMMGNHQGGLDFMTGVTMIQRAGISCGSMITFMKDVLKWFPMVGWINYFQGSVFLKRSWEHDRKQLVSKFESINSSEYPNPFWIGMYPEGTRKTHRKLQQSQEFAHEHGLPHLKHVLIPRAKGFISVLNGLSRTLKNIYDCTVCYESEPLYVSDCFRYGNFRTKRIHIHLVIEKVEDVWDDKKAWLLDAFCKKDKRIDAFLKNGGYFDGSARIVPPNILDLYSTFIVFSVLFNAHVGLFFGNKVFTAASWLMFLYSFLLSMYRYSNSQSQSLKYVEDINSAQQLPHNSYNDN